MNAKFLQALDAARYGRYVRREAWGNTRFVVNVKEPVFDLRLPNGDIRRIMVPEMMLSYTNNGWNIWHPTPEDMAASDWEVSQYPEFLEYN